MSDRTECQCACHRSAPGITVTHLVPCCWPAPVGASDSPDENRCTCPHMGTWGHFSTCLSRVTQPQPTDDEIVAELSHRHCGATATRNVLAALRAAGYTVAPSRPDFVGAVAEIRRLCHAWPDNWYGQQIIAALDKAGAP